MTMDAGGQDSRMTLEDCQIYLILFYENTKQNAKSCSLVVNNTGECYH